MGENGKEGEGKETAAVEMTLDLDTSDRLTL